MTPPSAPGPGYPPQPPSGNDKANLYGGLGIPIGLLCCWPAGIVLGILSIREAKVHGKPITLGLVAIVASSIGMVLGLVLTLSGTLDNITGS